MKRIHLSTLVACFFLFSFSSLKAQHETYQPALWISMGWGAGDGPHVIEDYNLLSLGAQLQTKHKILILRLENGWDYAAATRQSYTVEAYKILCGYYKDFQDSQLYLATGISYSSHNFSGRYIDKGLVDNPVEKMESRIWGLPVELGFQLELHKRLAVGAATFLNINEVDSFLGYLVQVQFRVF